MKNEVRKRFNAAVALKEVGDFDGARTLLLQLHEDAPESSAVATVLADVCWELKQLDEAVSFFQKAKALNPDSEAVSLGLFHCLWELGRTDDAFNEMKRFLANNESEEYTRLLADINEN